MRSKINFDKSWMFYLGEIGQPFKTVRKAGMIGALTNNVDEELGAPFAMAGMKAGRAKDNDGPFGAFFRSPTTQDKVTGWREVDLPHDWRVEQEYSSIGSTPHQGYLPNNVGYYRKVFKIPKEDEGKKINIEFEGVTRNSSYWLNGCFLGDHYSGYTGFYFDITDLLKYGDEEGDNVLLVRTDTTSGDEGWWYEGGGIYRHVWLNKYDYLHVEQWGTFIYTKEIGEDDAWASICVESTVCNEYAENMNFKLKTTIYNPNDKIAAVMSSSHSMAALGREEVRQETIIRDPMLWTVDEPNLYRAVTEIFKDNNMPVDAYETVFGIRTVEYRQDGFFLNGKHVILKGTCNHQDHAGVGTAIPDAVHEYRVAKLKEMGCNAYRSAHNPASPALLDACDRLGMLVMDENRIMESTEIKIEDLKSMILRSRNHPSVVMWSLANEEIIGSSFQAKRMLRRLSNITKSLDKTRPVTTAELGRLEVDPVYFEYLDVISVNYAEATMNRKNENELDVINRMKEKYPAGKFLNAESVSHYATRGIYEDDIERGHCSCYGSGIRNNYTRSVGGVSTPFKSWRYYLDNPYTGGIFVWTGFDYRGEPTPFRSKFVSSQFGIIDTCGFPKDIFYYYKSIWTDEPMIHIMPHWNWPAKEGQNIVVRLYTNCHEAEVILNGRSQGRKPKQGDYIEWDVPYEADKIEAVGFKDGMEAARDYRVTAGEPYALHIEPMSNKGAKMSKFKKDVIMIAVTVRDKKGVIVPTAENSILVTVEGGAKLLGLGNGDPGNREGDKGSVKRAFNGHLLALIKLESLYRQAGPEAPDKSGGSSGIFRVKAQSPGCKEAVLGIPGEPSPWYPW